MAFILFNWYPTVGSLLCTVIVCTVVGGVTVGDAVIAKPKWLKHEAEKALEADSVERGINSN